MAVELLKESWIGKVVEVTIGATKEQGGTRSKAVTVGGHSTLPYLHFEGVTPNRPAIAIEMYDVPPTDWPEVAKEPFKDVLEDTAAWAKRIEESGADLICLKLVGTHPDNENRSPEEAAQTVRTVLANCSLPLIILGCGVDDKDNEVMPAVAEAAAGENCIIGNASQENYKSITAAAMVNKHILICQSPLDINIQKQLNILVNEMNLPLDRIVMDPLIGALGYGIEYAYSIMERSRLGALQNDKMLSMPVICTISNESWKAKESKEPEFLNWGAHKERAILWEAMTATTMLQAGGDILIMRHPEAVKYVNNHLDKLMTK